MNSPFSGLRSPSAVSPLCERMKMYKITTPPWKDSLRQKCMQRLRANRQRVVDRFRNLTADADDGTMFHCSQGTPPPATKPTSTVVTDCIRQEWDSLQKELSDGEINWYNDVYDEICRDLQDEESKIIEEYLESVMESEHRSLQADVDMYYSTPMHCPQCAIGDVEASADGYICTNQDCCFKLAADPSVFTLAHLKDRFSAIDSRHRAFSREMCPAETVSFEAGSHQLLSKCQFCGFHEIVIIG